MILKIIKKNIAPVVLAIVLIKGKLTTYFKYIVYQFKVKNNSIVKINVRNIPIKLVPKGQISELLFTSDFESDLLSIYSQYIKPGMNIVDVGANIGLYTLIAANLNKDKGRIWAFEPARDIFKILKSNLKINNSRHVTAINIGIAEKSGILHLVLEEDRLDGYRYIERVKSQKKLSETCPTEVNSLDQYFAKKMQNIDYMKIDVEGGELNVLYGAKKIIKSSNIIIQLENSKEGLIRSGHTQDDLFDFLKKLNLVTVAWNSKEKNWDKNLETVKKSGNIWACSKILLPNLLKIKA